MVEIFLKKVQELEPVYSNLGDPISISELHQTENELSVKLPQEFHALYLSHNGQKDYFGVGLFFGVTFLTLEELINHWRRQLPGEGAEKNAFAFSGTVGTVKSGYRNAKWIPFAYDHGGNYLGLDYDPGEKGVEGQVINYGRDEDVNYVLANSFQLFLDWYAMQINSENYLFNKLDESHISFRIKNPPAKHFFDVLKDIF